MCCRYFDTATAMFEASTGNPPESLGVQMSKMAVGLLSGKYSQPPEEEDPARVKRAESEDKMEVSEGERPSGVGEETQRPAAPVCGCDRRVQCASAYSTRPRLQVSEGVSPYMLRSLVGRGHPEFGTARQQDACEYLLHLFDFIDRRERAEPGPFNPTDCFKFQVWAGQGGTSG